MNYQKHMRLRHSIRPFSCNPCTSSFRAKQDLTMHIKTINSDKKLKCPVCDYVSNYQSKLTEHMKCLHYKPFTCAICDWRTGHIKQIRGHIASKHSPTSWASETSAKVSKSNSCELCSSSFKDRKNLDEHLKTAHTRTEFKCSICSHVAKTQHRLTEHMRRVHNKPFACAICGHKTGDKSGIRRHITNQHTPASWTLKENTKKNDKRFFCLICKKTFHYESTYQEHLNVHSGKRPFSCKLCTSSFRARFELNHHSQKVHSDKRFKCPTCDYVAKYKGKLTAHIRCAHEKPLTCDDCGYRTGEKRRLQQHIASKHTSSMSFVCEVCGKELATKISLYFHMKNIHFPEPKVCQTCGKVCPSNSKYSQHIFKCGKEKQKYECEKCGQTYSIKANLLEHMNKHLNRKPYKCKVCGMAFYQRIRLNTHKFVHCGAEFQCEICDRAFKRKDNMKSHMKRQHSKK